MKFTIAGTITAFAMLVAPEVRSGSQSDIMQLVIRPCVTTEALELDLPPEQFQPAMTIMFELDREYYEAIIDAVEKALRTHTDIEAKAIYAAGLAACLQNLDTWQGESE